MLKYFSQKIRYEISIHMNCQLLLSYGKKKKKKKKKNNNNNNDKKSADHLLSDTDIISFYISKV